MKNRALFMAVAVVAGSVVLSAYSAFAGEPTATPDASRLNAKLIEKNLAVNLTCNVPGAQADAAQLVRDLKDILPDEEFSSLTIPLMAILHDENADEPVRILSALALDRLGSDMGDYAIAQLPRYTDSGRLRKVCAALTEHRTRIHTPPVPDIADMLPLPEEEQ